MNAFQDMARYHYERKEWKKVIKSCEEGVLLVPQVRQDVGVGDIGQLEERLLLLLADACEEDGNMRRARECDEKAKAIWQKRGRPSSSIELVNPLCREALELWAAGRWGEADETLQSVLNTYVALLLFTGINNQKKIGVRLRSAVRRRLGCCRKSLNKEDMIEGHARFAHSSSSCWVVANAIRGEQKLV